MKLSNGKALKTFFLILSCIVMAFVFACKTDTNEPKSVLNDIYNIDKDLLNKLDNVETAAEFAGLLNEQTKRMSDLAPKMRIFQEKYPELAGEGRVPAELEPLLKRNRALVEKLGKKADPLMKKYEDDPLVMEALYGLASLAERGPETEKQTEK